MTKFYCVIIMWSFKFVYFCKINSLKLELFQSDMIYVNTEYVYKINLKMLICQNCHNLFCWQKWFFIVPVWYCYGLMYNNPEYKAAVSDKCPEVNVIN